MEQLKLRFTNFDSKDLTIFTINCDGNYAHSKNEHNERILQEATKEYLEKLWELQQEIIAKYEPQLIDNKIEESLVVKYRPDLTNRNFSEMRRKVYKEVWAGKEEPWDLVK